MLCTLQITSITQLFQQGQTTLTIQMHLKSYTLSLARQQQQPPHKGIKSRNQ